MSSAVEQVRSQYDQVPYTSHPFSQTAPEHLAAVAHLFGLKTPDVATSRVLELGCSSGGNLIPLAARHPGSKVLGLDLSGVQISQGQQRVAAMNLDNLELRQADLGEVDSDLIAICVPKRVLSGRGSGSTAVVDTSVFGLRSSECAGGAGNRS